MCGGDAVMQCLLTRRREYGRGVGSLWLLFVAVSVVKMSACTCCPLSWKRGEAGMWVRWDGRCEALQKGYPVEGDAESTPGLGEDVLCCS